MKKTQQVKLFIVGVLFFGIASGYTQNSEVALTVYNDNLALVKDVRSLKLQKGVFEYKFQDVAARIDPTSVYFKSLTAADKVAILEQNYEYDLVSSTKILQKYIDQQIKLTGKGGRSYAGKLLNASGKDIILQQAGGNIKIVSMGVVEDMDFPELPDGLITRPTLVWSLDSQESRTHQIEVGYLTSGIQWHAEYVGVANQDDSMLELGGWVSIDNKSGATYKKARLKLVAGDVHRARREYRAYGRPQEMLVKSMAAPDQFKEKAFFEYHLYTLQRPATVANNQIKQISLFPSTHVAVQKRYSYDGARDNKKVRVNLEFENKKEFDLGLPLPKGKVRVYKKDDDGALIFIGEDFIDHTPKNEKVRVFVGNAFDVVGQRTVKDRRTVDKKSWQEIIEIKLRNHKETEVTVTVIEHLNLNWEILRKTHPFKKRDAFTLEFEIKIAKDAEVVLEYVVRYNER